MRFTVEEELQHAPRVHAAHVLHVGAGHGLAVGHDGEALEGRARQPHRARLQQAGDPGRRCPGGSAAGSRRRPRAARGRAPRTRRAQRGQGGADHVAVALAQDLLELLMVTGRSAAKEQALDELRMRAGAAVGLTPRGRAPRRAAWLVGRCGITGSADRRLVGRHAAARCGDGRRRGERLRRRLRGCPGGLVALLVPGVAHDPLRSSVGPAARRAGPRCRRGAGRRRGGARGVRRRARAELDRGAGRGRGGARGAGRGRGPRLPRGQIGRRGRRGPVQVGGPAAG